MIIINGRSIALNEMDKYNFTLIRYALPYYIGEILHRVAHNLSYIYSA